MHDYYCEIKTGKANLKTNNVLFGINRHDIKVYNASTYFTIVQEIFLRPNEL